MQTLSSSLILRSASAADLSSLLGLEQEVFPPQRQESRRSLALSLNSASQEVWVYSTATSDIAAAMTLLLSPQSIRIYSLAVRSVYRGQGLGERLMSHAEQRARTLHKSSLRLEADADNPQLISWYLRQGFLPVTELPDYYGPHTRALRLQKRLTAERA
ncbi:N-acetyltransferase [Kiritimatiellota bacterium B12222]|nr:N-acetyltransferase [Kiritimatiellota bacterium B12222]